MPLCLMWSGNFRVRSDFYLLKDYLLEWHLIASQTPSRWQRINLKIVKMLSFDPNPNVSGFSNHAFVIVVPFFMNLRFYIIPSSPKHIHTFSHLSISFLLAK